MRILKRRPLFVAALVTLIAAFGYAWAVVTPTVGEPFTVATPPAGKPLWTFGFVGDTQQADDRLDPLMAKFESHDVEFVLHLGDMVDEAASDMEWDRLIAAALKHRVRLMPVVGNHDVRTDYADDGSIRFRQYFPDLPNTFYHFRHRGVNFLMLNSERSFAPGSEQAKFLKFHLDRQPGTAIACLHRPTFTADDRDTASMLTRRLWLHDALTKTDAVAVVSGHNHYYDRTKPLDGLTYIVSGGGGGATRETPQPRDFTASLHAGEHHYGIARVYDDRIAVEILTLDDGRTLDAFALPLKPTDRKQGGYRNRHSMELPPLAELPQYRRETLAARRAEHVGMPRPW
ncbi:MAG: metallophosphoesterase [Planctomycetia bacterium]|nr:metallophosphoesterase [Planctomycetia bacterium]